MFVIMFIGILAFKKNETNYCSTHIVTRKKTQEGLTVDPNTGTERRKKRQE
jgi:hypothetical protein